MSALLAAAALASTLLGAEPYVRLRSSETPSHCLWWDAGPVTVTQNAQGYAGIDGDAELLAISRSFQTWRTELEACSSLQLFEAARTQDRTVGLSFDPGATNTNLVLFRTKRKCADVVPSDDACYSDSDVACANKHDCWMHSAGALAITTSRFDARTGRMMDADIELNGASFTFTASDTGVVYDVENTITHEVGHLLGLDHSPDPASTMYDRAPAGEISKRSLDPGSIEFVCEVYPAGGYPQDCILERLDPRLGPASVTGCSAAAGGPLLLAIVVVLAALRRRGGGA